MPTKPMRQILLSLTITLATIGLSANAHADTKTIEVDDFTQVSYAVAFDVEFVIADEPFVKFEGDEDIYEDLKVRVHRDTLSIREDEGWFGWGGRDHDDVIVTIGYVELESIKMSGSGDGFAEQIDADQFAIKIAGSSKLEVDHLIANDLTISIAGSGDVALNDIDVDSVSSKIAGSGDVHLGGTTNSQEISIAGSGDHQASELRAKETDASIRGSGDIELWSESQLSVSIMGSGDVEYYGDPELQQSIMGSGSLERVGSAP